MSWVGAVHGRRRLGWVGLGLVSLSLPLLSGCPGSLDDPGLFVGEVDCIAYTENLLQSSCATGGCHDSIERAGDLNLTGAANDLGPTLLNAVSRSDDCGAGGHVLVDPNNLDTSLMLQKMGAAPPCGSRMPLFEGRPRTFEIRCMREWLSTLQ